MNKQTLLIAPEYQKHQKDFFPATRTSHLECFKVIFLQRSIPIRYLQDTARHCKTLQHTATHCNTLQHTATHCNTLQHTATHCNKQVPFGRHTLGHTFECHAPATQTFRSRECACSCNTHCNTLRHTATNCKTLQRTAILCNAHI